MSSLEDNFLSLLDNDDDMEEIIRTQVRVSIKTLEILGRIAKIKFARRNKT